jgi:hypothetical protein
MDDIILANMDTSCVDFAEEYGINIIITRLVQVVEDLVLS